MADPNETPSGIELAQTLTRERNDYAQRLARYELNVMLGALADGSAFKVASVDQDATAQPLRPFQAEMVDAGVMTIPLGRIAVHNDPKTLPVIGVLIDDDDAQTMGSLLNLLQELYVAPFARILFLTRKLEFLPFFDHFGFAVICIGQATADEVGPLIARRFNANQIKSAKNGTTLWATSQQIAGLT